MTELSILVVEDDVIILMSAVDMLTDMGHRVEQALTLAQARVIVEAEALDLVIVDQGLPDGHGLDFAKELREQHADLKILVASGSAVNPGCGMAAIAKTYSEADLATAIAGLFGW